MQFKIWFKRIMIVYIVVVLLTYQPLIPSAFVASDFPKQPFIGYYHNLLGEYIYQILGYGVFFYLGLLWFSFSGMRALVISTVFQWSVFTLFPIISWKGIVPYMSYQLLFVHLLPSHAVLLLSAFLLPLLFFPEMRALLRYMSKRKDHERYEDETLYWAATRTEPPKRAEQKNESSTELIFPVQKSAYEKTRPYKSQSSFSLPALNLLDKKYSKASTVSEQMAHQVAYALKKVLEDFGIRGEMGKISPGPVVTLYEFVPAPGIKTSLTPSRK